MSLKRFLQFLKEDTWQSWLVSLVLIIIFIKLIFFPGMSLITKSPLPLVVVESCSMYHNTHNMENWWNSNGVWYEKQDITKNKFNDFPFKYGLNKGDIILVSNRKQPKQGDIIIFEPNKGATTAHPVIHRVITTDPTATKGDHNSFQFNGLNNAQNLTELDIQQEQILGKATGRIPLIGWLKLIFFEPSRPSNQRGFCS